jgi:hypothetical protein
MKKGGEAVLSARNLLAAVDTAERFYNDPLLCQVAERSMASASNNPAIPFSVTPVPAKDFIRLDYQLPQEGADYLFTVYDLAGKRIGEYNLPADSSRMVIDIPANWKSGMYLFFVSGSLGTVASGKVIIAN